MRIINFYRFILLEIRCAIAPDTRREIVEQLQNLLHQHNTLVQTFKTKIDIMPSDEHTIRILPERRASTTI